MNRARQLPVSMTRLQALKVGIGTTIAAAIAAGGAWAAEPVGQTMAETIARAEDAVRAAEPVAAAEPHRPVFHFRPPAQWMNDICGAFWHDGWYHIL